MGTSIHILILLFLLYSAMGWMLEVAFHYYKKRRFVNRGFLKGPFCPIYGTGAILMLVAVGPYRDYPVVFALGAFIVPTILELVVGIVLMKLFKARWWNYSGCRFNYRGFICLRFSLMWGMFSYVFIGWLNPVAEKLIDSLPPDLTRLSAVMLFSLFAVDTVFTVYKLIDFKSGLEAVKLEKDEILLMLSAKYDKAENALRTKVKFYNNHIDQFIMRQRRFIDSYPELTSAYFKDVLDDIRDNVSRVKEKIRNRR